MSMAGNYDSVPHVQVVVHTILMALQNVEPVTVQAKSVISRYKES